MLKKFFQECGYEVISRKQGGLAIAAKPHLKLKNATTTTHPNIVAGRIVTKEMDLVVIGAYGLQESDNADDRNAFFDELSIEVESSNNPPIIVGDLNSKVEEKEGSIKGSSGNGKLLENLIEKYSYKAVNFHPNCTGKWTRVQEKGEVTERSVIDYILVNDALWIKIIEVFIDEEKAISPFGIKKKKQETVKSFSDHNPIHLSLDIQSEQKQKGKSVEEFRGWKITSEGLEEFKKLTTGTAGEKNSDINTYSDLTEYIERKMDICFKRKKNNQDSWSPDNRIKNGVFVILKKQLKKGKAQRKAARVYIEYLHEKELEALQKQQSEKIGKKIAQLEDENGRFCINNFWKIKKSAGKVVDDKSSVINREGVEVFSDEAIVTEYENEFKHRLAHLKIDKSLENYEKRSHALLKLLLQEAMKNKEPDFTIKELIDGIMSFKNGKSPGLDWFPAEMLKNAGMELLEMILEVLNYIKNTLNIPSSWEEVLIQTLYKKKGSKKLLENYRGVFLSSVMYKLMEKLIKPE